ncbi:hypothetical protein DL93DRAFT_2071698 [Clavulina sp. PMI_390]|nr:hypothetical protein DL93DRAFT_2071698 [Clavulina sp. PMI_390]
MSPPPGSSYSLANLLISSAINIPASQAGSSPRGPANALLSSKDPLSIPITTTNFRRFISRVGFVFWVMDRMEEIFMWRKGWKYTTSWLALYCAVCYKPRLLLVAPSVALLAVMIANYHSPPAPATWHNHTEIADPSVSLLSQPPVGGLATEGSSAWLANIQAIQNLMGFVADAYDMLFPLTHLITFKSHASTPIFLFILFTTIPLTFLPLQLFTLIAGVGAFTLTHPLVRHHLFDKDGILQQSRIIPIVIQEGRSLVNDSSLSEEHITAAELREVFIFQNERWSWPSSAQTSSAGGSIIAAGWKGGVNSLKASDRGAWTRGADGSVTVGESSSHLVVQLDPGWAFVETEQWEPDFLARWAPTGADRDGWVYTNDAWLDPRPAPVEEWQKPGMTRRRRWVRRIYPVPIRHS